MKTIILVLASALGSTVFAAQNGSITIQGNVSAQTHIVVTPVSGYNSLDLSTTQVDLTVANVREKNNTTSGYTVTLTSTNSGALKNGTAGSIAYTAKYNGSSVSLSSTPFPITSGAASTSVVNVVKAFAISYTGVDPESMMQGTYSDTLTFTIASP